MTSKAERIRTLLDEGILSTQEIADRIGCLPEYVRAVDHRRSKSSWYARARKNGDRAKARREGRWAYLKSTLAGEPSDVATWRYGVAWKKTMAKTARNSASR